jgi:hypothetical protein
MEYVMLINGAEDEWDGQDEETMAEAMRRIGEYVDRWQAAGKILPGGYELDAAAKAKTIRSGPDGKPVVTDGPYLELKEVIGGFLVIQADDIDEAVAIAAGWPALMGTTSVEVRPVMAR